MFEQGISLLKVIQLRTERHHTGCWSGSDSPKSDGLILTFLIEEKNKVDASEKLSN